MPTFKNANLAQIIFLEKLMTVTQEDNKIQMGRINRIIREAVVNKKDKIAKKAYISYNTLINNDKQISRDLNNLKFQRLIKSEI
jgi:histone H3/H4